MKRLIENLGELAGHDVVRAREQRARRDAVPLPDIGNRPRLGLFERVSNRLRAASGASVARATPEAG